MRSFIKKHGVNQAKLARAVGVSPTVINLLINHGAWPKKNPDQLREKIEAYFTELNISLPSELFNTDTEDYSMNKELLTQAARELYGIHRDPFTDDVQGHEDVFLSAEQRYIRESLYNAAKNGGFIGLIGESGCGKTTLRRDLADRIAREDANIKIISPVFPDKSRLTVASIVEAIIDELNPNISVKRSLEAKARQMERMLRDSSRAGMSHCLLIEEAHDLTLPMLKNLKRFWELEDGFKKLLSIVLIGQPELKNKLNERMNWDAREVIRRIEQVELHPLGDKTGDYLVHKFKRINVDIKKIFTEDAISAMESRLTQTTRDRKLVSMSYPLIINNLTTKVMNHAADIGAPVINADIVNSL